PLGARQHAREAALLDAVQQLFLAADVVVHPGERHARSRGEVAHGGRVVALVGEHLRRPGQEVIQPLVVGAHRVRTVVRILKLEAGVGEFKGGSGRGWSRTVEDGRGRADLYRLLPPSTVLILTSLQRPPYQACLPRSPSPPTPARPTRR